METGKACWIVFQDVKPTLPQSQVQVDVINIYFAQSEKTRKGFSSFPKIRNS